MNPSVSFVPFSSVDVELLFGYVQMRSSFFFISFFFPSHPFLNVFKSRLLTGEFSLLPLF